MDTTTLGAALALAKSIPRTAVSEAAAVLAEAETVAASIPQDYSELSDDVDELKSHLNAMQTATASDVGKALKAKTVTDGKVTEWEFGDVGGTNISCDVDANGNATLSLGEEDLSDIAELVGGTA